MEAGEGDSHLSGNGSIRKRATQAQWDRFFAGYGVVKKPEEGEEN